MNIFHIEGMVSIQEEWRILFGLASNLFSDYLSKYWRKKIH